MLPVSGPAALGQERRILIVTHAATSTTLVTPNSNGHQLGDLRVDSLATKDESGAEGRLDATLITTGIDTPAPGDEARIGQLVFRFTDRSQIVVGGVAAYPGKVRRLRSPPPPFARSLRVRAVPGRRVLLALKA